MITEEQAILINALAGATFQPGSWDKRFARDMRARLSQQPEKDLSEKQVDCLYAVAWRYRRQIRGRALAIAIEWKQRQVVGTGEMMKFQKEVAKLSPTPALTESEGVRSIRDIGIDAEGFKD